MDGTIDIGGRKVPVWVIAAGVIGAVGLFILVRFTGGAKGGGEDPAAGGDLAIADLADQFQKALNDQNAALISSNSQIQKQIDTLTAANAKTNSDLTSALTKAIADLTAYINAHLSGGNPSGGGGGTTTPGGNTPVYTPTGNPITLTPVGLGGVNPYSVSGSNITIPPAVTFQTLQPTLTINPNSVTRIYNFNDWLAGWKANPVQLYNTGNYNIQVGLQGDQAFVVKYKGEAGAFSGLPSEWVGAIKVPKAALGVDDSKTFASVPDYLLNLL